MGCLNERLKLECLNARACGCLNTCEWDVLLWLWMRTRANGGFIYRSELTNFHRLTILEVNNRLSKIQDPGKRCQNRASFGVQCDFDWPIRRAVCPLRIRGAMLSWLSGAQTPGTIWGSRNRSRNSEIMFRFQGNTISVPRINCKWKGGCKQRT